MKNDWKIKTTSSVEHDLGKSCFQFWPITGDEGDKAGEADTVIFRNFVTVGADYESHNLEILRK